MFSNSNKKFALLQAGGCNQDYTTNSTGSLVSISGNGTLGVNLYVMDVNGNKYYLRTNSASNSALELVCQSYFDQVWMYFALLHNKSMLLTVY